MRDFNPDTKEAQAMTRDNERSVFAAKMEERNRTKVSCVACGAEMSLEDANPMNGGHYICDPCLDAIYNDEP